MNKKLSLFAAGIIAVMISFTSIYDLFRLRSYDGITPLFTKEGVYIDNVEKGSPAHNVGIRKGSYIVGVDNKITIYRHAFNIHQILNESDKSSIPYFVNENQISTTKMVHIEKRRNLTVFQGITTGVSLILLFISLMLMVNNPEPSETRVFFFLNLIILLLFSCTIRPFSYSTLNLVIMAIGKAVLIMFPISIFHFFLVYPEKNKWLIRFPFLSYLMYILPVSAGIVFNILIYSNGPTSIEKQYDYFIFFLTLFCMLASLYNIRKYTVTKKEGIPVKISLLFATAMFPYTLLGLPAWLFLQKVRIFEFFSLFILIIPIYLSYHILKFGFVNVKLILKKSFLYSLILAALSVFYAVIIFFINTGVSKLNPDPYIYSIGFAVVIVFFFNPLNDSLKRYLEVLMFKKERELTEKVAIHAEKFFDITDRNELEKEIFGLLQKIIKKESVLFIHTEKNSFKKIGEEQIIEVSSNFDAAHSEMILLEKADDDDLKLYYNKGFRFGYTVFKLGQVKAFLLTRVHLFLDEREAVKRMLLQFVTAYENTRLVERVSRQVELEKDMEIAGMIQKSLIPSTHPDNDDIKAYGVSVPSKMVGGDFFDYIHFQGSRKIGFLVGDVAGKSIPAALMMVAAKEIIDLKTSTIPETDKVMSEANKIIFQKSNRKMFVASCYSVLDPEKRSISLVNAGMPSPLLIRDGVINTIPRQKVRYPLGLIKDVSYKEQVISLNQNDILVFFTDGVSEGLDSVLNQIVSESIHDSVKVTTNNILKQLKKRSGNILQDDATVVVVKADFNGNEVN